MPLTNCEKKHDFDVDSLLRKSRAHIAAFTGIDPRFARAGEEAGIEIWRIEDLKLVFLDKPSYGQFCESDCYIVLTTTRLTGKLAWDLHYWKGSKASIDKSCVCAIKISELYRHLRHQSKQHQEVQGQESDLFKGYFTKMKILRGGTPSGLKVVNTPRMTPRLFQIKGPKGHVFVKMVNPHNSSLNSGDVFVLETEDVVYQWTGKQATIVKRATALEFTSHLKLFRPKQKQVELLYEEKCACQPLWAALQAARARLFQIEESRAKTVNPHWSSLNSKNVFVLETENVVYQWTGKEVKRATALECTAQLKLYCPNLKQLEILSEADCVCHPFWAALQGRPRTIKTPKKGSDELHARRPMMDLFCFRGSEATGQLEISLIDTNVPTLPESPVNNKHRSLLEAVGPLKQFKLSQFKEDSVYLLDCDWSLFLWCGKRVSSKYRTRARAMAMASIPRFNRPSWVPLISVLPPNPVPEFWINFVDRHARCILPVFALDHSIQMSSSPTGTPVSLAAAQKQLTSKRAAVVPAEPIPALLEDDPGTGALSIHRVDKVAMVQLAKNNEGFFNDGFSYIITYSYLSQSKLRHLIYYWEGAQRPYGSWLTWKCDLAPQLTRELEKTAGVPPICARVVQGKEPPSFCSLFASPKKQLVIFNYPLLSQEGPKLFTVYGFDASSIVGKEVKCCSSTLSSGQCSVLLCESTVFLWYGTYSNLAECEAAGRMCERLRAVEERPCTQLPIVCVYEGTEPELFWEAIGGKKQYWKLNEKEGQIRQKETNPAPRVFRVVHDQQPLALEELHQYSSQDLGERDTMITLAYGKVYLWFGKNVTADNKRTANLLMNAHLEYTQTARMDFVEEYDGNESLAFRCMFGMFDVARSFADPYLPKMAALLEQGVMGREVGGPPRFPQKSSIEERSWWLRPSAKRY